MPSLENWGGGLKIFCGMYMYICVPSMPVLTKWRRLKYSSRSFCMGVPESRILAWSLQSTECCVGQIVTVLEPMTLA